MSKPKRKRTTPVKQLSENDLVLLIYESIIVEPFLDKNIIVPKIRALIKSFRMNLSQYEPNAKDLVSMAARIERLNVAIQRHSRETHFFKSELEKINGIDMKQIYEKRDRFLIEKGIPLYSKIKTPPTTKGAQG